MTPMVVAIFAGFAILTLAQVELSYSRPRTVDIGAAALSLVALSVSSGLTALLAVIIHRYVILQEVARFFDLRRLAPVILEFAAVTLIVQLVVAAGLLLAFPLSALFGSAFVTAVLGLGLIISAVYLGLRICLVFPAIAVETPGRSLRSAFRFGEGLVLRLFLAGLLSALGISAVAAMVGALFGRGSLFANLVGIAVEMALVMTSVAIVSQVYAWRMRRSADWNTTR